MVLTAENTRFCQRSATPGCLASSDAISWYPTSVGVNAKIQRPRPKNAKLAPFGRLRTPNIDTLTQRLHTRTIEPRYVRAIRSFFVLSNLGCEGVNRWCAAVTCKQRLVFRGRHRNCCET